MSDELIKSLNARIAELERDRDKAVARRMKSRDENAALRKELETTKAELSDLVNTAESELGQTGEQIKAIQTERDELRAKLDAGPDEKAARINELETALRTRDYRDKFTGAVKDLAEGFAVDDIWHYAQFDPAKAETLADAQVGEIVAKARQLRPAMFARSDAPGNGAAPSPGVGQSKPAPKPLVLGDVGSRGARDGTSGTLAYTRKETQSPGWMKTPRGRAIVEAREAGSAVLVDDAGQPIGAS